MDTDMIFSKMYRNSTIGFPHSQLYCGRCEKRSVEMDNEGAILDLISCLKCCRKYELEPAGLGRALVARCFGPIALTNDSG